ncbi:MAG: NADP-dependent oxidoreductase [Candidatus Azobacteroides sp.]|nr:NADP-dependent oxidoreductase [Candidatus Azobacteroides sp.]
MNAIRIYAYGGPEVLKFETDVPVPEIKENQVLVRNHATTVNHLEIKITSGKKKDQMPVDFPWIPGYDFAGIVEKTGEKVTSFKEGDEVYFKTNGGTYASHLAVDENMLIKKPRNISFEEAATVPHVGLTAWQGLFTHGKLGGGKKVLIQGAAGAVGAFAVQIAKDNGAYVYGTASTDDIEFLKIIGADVAIDYHKTDFTEIVKDVDIVFDLVGGETQKKSYSVLKKGGILVTTVGPVMEEEARKYGVKATTMLVKPNLEDMKHITRMIEADKIIFNIKSVYSLANAAEAWEEVVSKKTHPGEPTHGQIVLDVINYREDYRNPKP